MIEPSRSELVAWAGELSIAYCETFGGPPWNEAERAADRFLARLFQRSEGPGFRCILAVDHHHRLVGFGYGATTSRDFGADISYASVVSRLGPEVTDAALKGCFEVVELGVIPAARRRGVGSRLHDSLLALATEARAWLMTRSDADAHVFYSHREWLDLAVVDSGRGNQVVMTRRLI